MNPLPAAWGLCPHHQTKLSNVGSASLIPTEAEDVESNQSLPRTQHSLPDQSEQLLFFLIQAALLRANFRKFSETTFRLLTTPSLADTMRRRHGCQHQLQTSTSLTQHPLLRNKVTALQHLVGERLTAWTSTNT